MYLYALNNGPRVRSRLQSNDCCAHLAIIISLPGARLLPICKHLRKRLSCLLHPKQYKMSIPLAQWNIYIAEVCVIWRGYCYCSNILLAVALHLHSLHNWTRKHSYELTCVSIDRDIHHAIFILVSCAPAIDSWVEKSSEESILSFL